MDKDLFYGLGRLSALADLTLGKMKSVVLLFLAKHFVQSINTNGQNLSIVDVLEPEAYDKNPKDIHKLVMYIKSVNNIVAKKEPFNSKLIQSFVKSLGLTIEVEYKNDFDGLLESIKKLQDSIPSQVYYLLLTGLVNLYFVCNGYIKYPIIDFVKDASRDAIIEAVANSNGIILQTKKLIKEDRNKLHDYTKSVPIFFDYVVNNPVFDIGMSIDETGLSFATSSKVVSILEGKGILEKISGNLRYRIYKYTRMLNIFS